MSMEGLCERAVRPLFLCGFLYICNTEIHNTNTKETEMVSDTNNLATGTRATATWLLYNELSAMVTDMRWGLVLLLLLVIADFRFGWRESQVRYAVAKQEKDNVGIEKYRWHTSRAIRRTTNKCIDYLIMMLVGGAIGMALLEPIGLDHIWGCWGGACIVAVCEVFSIFGHFFFIRGVTVEKRTLKGFFKALVVALAKQKNEAVGEALESSLDEVTETKTGEGEGASA